MASVPCHPASQFSAVRRKIGSSSSDNLVVCCYAPCRRSCDQICGSAAITGVRAVRWRYRRAPKTLATLRNSLAQADGGLKSPPVLLQLSTMEEAYDQLAERLLSAAERTPSNSKYVVGLAGPPGAGKSTVANEVVTRLNAMWRQRKLNQDGAVNDLAVALPMDGFHLYRRQLDAMKDPAAAHARRGAPWTFDPANLLQGLVDLRIQGWASFPSFDHGVGDPVEDDIVITYRQKVVLVEGNYLLLANGYWKELADIFDETWFIQVDMDEAMRRVEKRHIATGSTPDRASWRVVNNDRPNAELIACSGQHANVVIPSTPLAKPL